VDVYKQNGVVIPVLAAPREVEGAILVRCTVPADSYLALKGVRRAPQARSPFQPIVRYLLGSTRLAENAKATASASAR
jgi:hypothetical protein